jgi:hypothetical protein
MKHYKKLPETGNVLWDWFAGYVNMKLMKHIIIRIAKNEHIRTGRQIHVSEMFNSFMVFDGRERKQINRSGKLGKMDIQEALEASIWNSNQIK